MAVSVATMVSEIAVKSPQCNSPTGRPEARACAGLKACSIRSFHLSKSAADATSAMEPAVQMSSVPTPSMLP